jgi:hypothetical protein
MDGKQRCLNVVKSDLESIELSGSTLEAIRHQAQAILSQFNAENETRSASLPYPIIFGSSIDVRWGKTTKGRISVSFNGIDKYLKTADPDLKEWFKVNKEIFCDTNLRITTLICE